MAKGSLAFAIESTKIDWVQAHEMLSRLARTRALADAEEGRWLLAALRSAAHVHLGFGGFSEYVQRLFGYTARTTQEKLRVAEALEELPAVAQALEGGLLNWSAVLELTRVAVEDTEREWLEAARGKTVHQLEALVAGKLPGDRPASPAKLAARRHVLRFEVAAETLCLFRETLQKLRCNSATPLDDDAALLLMARQILTGPGDDGRASYQIALSLCPACGAGHQQAGGELVPVGADVVAMANCDGQHLGLIRAPIMNERVRSCETAHTGAAVSAERDSFETAHTGPAVTAQGDSFETARTGPAVTAQGDSFETAHTGAAVGAERDSFESAHTGAAVVRNGAHVGAAAAERRADTSPSPISLREARGDARTGVCPASRVLPALAPDARFRIEANVIAADTGAVTTHHELRRAKQTIPPATRRAVLRRDHGSCAVPGCRNSRYLDIHHIRPRSEGGDNDSNNLIALCGAHHRAVHRGELGITGSIEIGVRFRHADGKDYGQAVDSRAIVTQVKVFAALRRLGFREVETRRVLAQIGANREPQERDFERFLREALARLTAQAG
jgi:hypothetical protein